MSLLPAHYDYAENRLHRDAGSDGPKTLLTTRVLAARARKVSCPQSCNVRLVHTRQPVCCIYHAPREVGESSSEDDSSSSSDNDSDSGPDNSTARMGNRRSHRRDCQDRHDHCGGASDEREHGHGGGDEAREKNRRRKHSPNAYEKIPGTKHKKGGGGTITEFVKE